MTKRYIFQACTHKILTGRRSRMHTMRKTSGLEGFPKRDESVYDAFGTRHSSTSISWHGVRSSVEKVDFLLIIRHCSWHWECYGS